MTAKIAVEGFINAPVANVRPGTRDRNVRLAVQQAVAAARPDHRNNNGSYLR